MQHQLQDVGKIWKVGTTASYLEGMAAQTGGRGGGGGGKEGEKRKGGGKGGRKDLHVYTHTVTMTTVHHSLSPEQLPQYVMEKDVSLWVQT